MCCTFSYKKIKDVNKIEAPSATTLVSIEVSIKEKKYCGYCCPHFLLFYKSGLNLVNLPFNRAQVESW
jgi:hypothetical protein